jgi:hypothetical protein
MDRMFFGPIACFIVVWIFPSIVVLADDVETQIRTILKVQKEGAGHAAAVPALKSLTQQPMSALLPLLRGMDQANPLAANWLRGAFEAIADRNLKDETLFPKKELEEFTLDRTHASQSRQLAFDWLLKIDPSASDRLVPRMLDDPCAEFRRESVQRLIDAARKAGEAKHTAESKEIYLRAFRAALDPDQLNLVFDELTKMGEKPDLKSQLGLLNSWWLIGPFDHRNGVGFDAVYAPELEINLQKKYAGTVGEVSWQKKESDERHSVLDLNTLIARHKGAVAYAYHEFETDQAQHVEIRLGTPNGWKLWVNGKLIFAHEEYHLLTQMDQYRTPVLLQAGTNRILLKICQNEQTEDWAQDWKFQVRVCDASGTAVLPSSMKQLDDVNASQK